MFRITAPFIRACAAVAGGGLLVASVARLPASEAIAGPEGGLAQAHIAAQYEIAINGLGIGTLRFTSHVTRDRYALDTNVELSALLGVFHWKGVTHTSGTIAASKPRPAGFLFEFASSSKSGSVKMDFNQGGVEAVSIQPFAVDAPDTVPLKKEQLQSVLDPLSAILSLTHADGQSPCTRTLAIFDGRHRFDLELSYRRHVPIGETQQELAIVCRVKYIPLGGYRPTEEVRAMARSTGIEIAFRPVPRARLMLPQEVTVPTAAGPVQLTLQRVDIDTPDSGKIALVD
jgi:hypothetical protein